jgi:hypothetical protein
MLEVNQWKPTAKDALISADPVNPEAQHTATIRDIPLADWRGLRVDPRGAIIGPVAQRDTARRSPLRLCGILAIGSKRPKLVKAHGSNPDV